MSNKDEGKLERVFDGVYYINNNESVKYSYKIKGVTVKHDPEEAARRLPGARERLKSLIRTL